MRKLLTLTLLTVTLFVSCSDNLSEMNEDPKNPNEVPAKTLFSNAQVSYGTYMADINVNINVFKLHGQYWAQTQYPSESQYELTTRSIPSNIWSEIYRDVLQDLDDAQAQISEDELLNEAVKQNQLASIEIMKVLGYSLLVKTFGDIPYSEALDPENTSPAFDDQEEVYMDLISRLNTAIGNINPNAAGFGNADVMYGGDMAAWLKFANSLKMRMAITIADVSNPEHDPQTLIEDAAPNAFTSNADNAEIDFQSAPPHTNPIYFEIVSEGRKDFVPANTLVDQLNDLEDPRRPSYFTKGPNDSIYVGGTYGASNDYGALSHITDEIKEPTFPHVIMDYAEVRFIMAEAAERGYNVSGSAAEHYHQGIRASMNYWDVPSDSVDSYLDQSNVDYGSAPGDWKQKIGTQKWIAHYLQGFHGWTTWRRLGAPEFNVPPEGWAESELPVRYSFPVDEQNLNQSNYEGAVSNMGIGDSPLLHNLFWDMD